MLYLDSVCFTLSICASVSVVGSIVERRVAPRIMLVKPSSWAKRTLASVKGPRMPSRGFHSPRRCAFEVVCAAAAAAAEVSRVRLVIAFRLYAENLPENTFRHFAPSGYGHQRPPEGDRPYARTAR